MSIMTQTYDAIVVGAGSVGVSTALALAQVGLRTLVVDQMTSVGQGCNKHAIGGVRATHSDPSKIALCLRSIEILSSWHEQYGDDIEWHRGGYVFVAYREQERTSLLDLLADQQAHGLDIDWLDTRALLEVAPALNPQGLLGGTYSPRDGYASPLLALHAQYRRAQHLGADFRFGEHVGEVKVQDDRVHGVRTDSATYHAPVVVNAAGAGARALCVGIGETLPIRCDAHEAGITEPVAHMVEPLIVDIRATEDTANCYFFQHRTGQFVFCMTPHPNAWGTDSRETSSFLPLVARRLIALVPQLGHVRVRRTWRGLYPMTPDGRPIVGWSREVEGLLNAGGMCGQGFMLGPGVGELVARAVTGTLDDQDRDILANLSPYRSFSQQEQLK
jgi:sarcosine oxidase subunit beta